ncbi:MAG: tetratricopeptide repeat protein [Betaproteobacteria bacterium]|nr:MAG: tetratricopeptide repeat protein [Betaproteobacteria bacterium]
MFGWLSKPKEEMQAAPTDSADRLIAEGNRAEDSGELLRACELYRQALALAPRYAKAHINLGIALEAMGDGTGAIRSYEQVLAADPANPAANYNLGKLVHVRGELSRAEELLTRALQGRPDFPEARIVLGSVLASQGKWQQARTELEEALRQRPDDFGALFHYAGVLRALNRLDDARTMLQRALAIDPSNADAHAALSDVLCAQSDLAGATAELEAVLTQRPDWADALHNYGCILRRQLRLAEAESAFRRALAAQPGHASTCRMLGEVLLAQCRTEEAFEHYRVARRHCPQDFGLESAELFALCGSERISDADLFARHAAFGKRIEEAYAPLRGPFRNATDPQRRLRIGYLSGDFRYHVVTLHAAAFRACRRMARRNRAVERPAHRRDRRRQDRYPRRPRRPFRHSAARHDGPAPCTRSGHLARIPEYDRVDAHRLSDLRSIRRPARNHGSLPHRGIDQASAQPVVLPAVPLAAGGGHTALCERRLCYLRCIPPVQQDVACDAPAMGTSSGGSA